MVSMARDMASQRAAESACVAASLCLPPVWPDRPRTAPVRLLVLGDSLTAGYGLAAADGFQAQLAAALRGAGPRRDADRRRRCPATPRAGGRARLDWALGDGADAAMWSSAPMTGCAAPTRRRWRPTSPPSWTRWRRSNIPVLLTGMYAPPNLGAATATSSAPCSTGSGSRPGVLYDPFFLQGVAGDPALNQADRIHPNPAGVKRVVARILPPVDKLLDGGALMRLFVGLDLPWELRDRLAGSAAAFPARAGCRRRTTTSRCASSARCRAIGPRRSTTRWPRCAAAAFDLALTGVGTFAKAGRDVALWAGVERNPALDHLQAKIETALQRAGLEPERRRFPPHVTLARLDSAAEAQAGRFRAGAQPVPRRPGAGGAFHPVQLAAGQGGVLLHRGGGIPARGAGVTQGRAVLLRRDRRRNRGRAVLRLHRP